MQQSIVGDRMQCDIEPAVPFKEFNAHIMNQVWKGWKSKVSKRRVTVISSSLHSSNFPTQRQAALAVVTGTTRLKRLTLKNPLSYWAATVGDNFTNHVPDGEGLGGGVQSVPKHLWLSSMSLTKVDFFFIELLTEWTWVSFILPGVLSEIGRLP